MPKIVVPAQPKTVQCEDCGAVIEYFPEEVEMKTGTSFGDFDWGYKRIKCPRIGPTTKHCPGYGYIQRW